MSSGESEKVQQESLNNVQSITILGSGPNALIGSGDWLYVANRSFRYYPNALSSHREAVFVTQSLDALEVVEFVKTLGDASVRPVHVWEPVVETERFRLLGIDGPHSLTFWSQNQLNDALNAVSGLRSPLPIYCHAVARPAQKLVARIQKFRRPNSAIFRPSTGMLALVFAIAAHGPNAIYRLSGIGFSNRTQHADGSSRPAARGVKRFVPPHAIADMIVLESLATKHEIWSDSREIVELVDNVLPISTT